MDGHIRLCAGCNREWFIPGVTERDRLPGEPTPFFCPGCRRRRADRWPHGHPLHWCSGQCAGRSIVLGARGAGRTALMRRMAAEARARGLDVLETRDLPPHHSPEPHPWSWDTM